MPKISSKNSILMVSLGSRLLFPSRALRDCKPALPRLAHDELLEAALPAAPGIEHFRRVDELERQAMQRRGDAPAGGDEFPLRQEALGLLADHEVVVEQGGGGVGRPAGHADPVRPRHGWREAEPAGRQAVLL